MNLPYRKPYGMSQWIIPGLPSKSDENILETIASYIALQSNLELSDLKSRVQDQATCEARQISMYLTLKLTGLTLKQIGKFFGRDHSTVINAKKRVEDLMFCDIVFKNRVQTYKQKLVTL